METISPPKHKSMRDVEMSRVLTKNESQPLDALKIRMLNGHNVRVSKQLLGIVVDELAIDEDVDPMVTDFLDLNSGDQKWEIKRALPFVSFSRVQPPRFLPPSQQSRLGHGYRKL